MLDSASLKRLISHAHSKLADLEAAAHRVMDREQEWWPFAFLRPEPEEYFTTLRVALLSCLYGLPAALFSVLASRVAGDVHSLHLSTLLGFACASIFLVYRFTFAYSWNRRAARLQQLSARRAAWRTGNGV